MRGGIEEHIHASLLWSYAGQGEHKITKDLTNKKMATSILLSFGATQDKEGTEFLDTDSFDTSTGSV